MKRIKVDLGSNTRIVMETRGTTVKEAWITIDQGTKFVQTAAKLAELEELRDGITQLLAESSVSQ